MKKNRRKRKRRNQRRRQTEQTIGNTYWTASKDAFQRAHKEESVERGKKRATKCTQERVLACENVGECKKADSPFYAEECKEPKYVTGQIQEEDEEEEEEKAKKQ